MDGVFEEIPLNASVLAENPGKWFGSEVQVAMPDPENPSRLIEVAVCFSGCLMAGRKKKGGKKRQRFIPPWLRGPENEQKASIEIQLFPAYKGSLRNKSAGQTADITGRLGSDSAQFEFEVTAQELMPNFLGALRKAYLLTFPKRSITISKRSPTEVKIVKCSRMSDGTYSAFRSGEMPWLRATKLQLPAPTFFCPDGLSEELARLNADVDRFLHGRAWYEQRYVPYKRGYLLSGPTAVGKMTFIKALASRIRAHLHIIDLADGESRQLSRRSGDPNDDPREVIDDELERLVLKLPDFCILVLRNFVYSHNTRTRTHAHAHARTHARACTSTSTSTSTCTCTCRRTRAQKDTHTSVGMHTCTKHARAHARTDRSTSNGKNRRKTRQHKSIM